MAGLKTDLDWSLMFVDPSVVKAVASLIEGYAVCKEDYTPIEFLRAVFDAAEDNDAPHITKSWYMRYISQYTIPKKSRHKPDHKSTYHADSSDRKRRANHSSQKVSAENITDSDTDNLICSYPEICKMDLSCVEIPADPNDGRPVSFVSQDSASSNTLDRTYKYMGCTCTPEDAASSSSGSSNSDSIQETNDYLGGAGRQSVYPATEINRDMTNPYFPDSSEAPKTGNRLPSEWGLESMSNIIKQKNANSKNTAFHDSRIRNSMKGALNFNIDDGSRQQIPAGSLFHTKTDDTSKHVNNSVSRNSNSKTSERNRSGSYPESSEKNLRSPTFISHNDRTISGTDLKNNEERRKSTEISNEFADLINNIVSTIEEEGESDEKELRQSFQNIDDKMEIFTNKATILEPLDSNSEECSKSNRPTVCAMYSENDLETGSQNVQDSCLDNCSNLNGPSAFYVRLEEQYKHAAIKLFLLILDHEEFLAIAIRGFSRSSLPHIYVHPAFFRVLAFLLFFNLNPCSFEGIKQNLVDTYPMKSLQFLRYITSDAYQSSTEELLSVYDTEFVTEYAHDHVKGDLMEKMYEAIKEFLEQQKSVPAKNADVNQNLAPCSTECAAEDQSSIVAGQVDPERKTCFLARPVPQTTYTAPKSKYYTCGAIASLLKRLPKKCGRFQRMDGVNPKRRTEQSVLIIHAPQPTEGDGPKRETESQLDSSTENRCAGCFSAAAPPKGTHFFSKTIYGKRNIEQEGRTKQETRDGKMASLESESTTFNAKPGYRFYKTPPKFSKVAIPVKPTATSVLREGARLRQDEQKVLQKLDWVASGGADYTALEAMLEKAREEEQLEDLETIERKHLQGLLSYEEALIARRNNIQKHKDNVFQFKKEKEQWEKQLEEFRREEEEKIKLLVDKGHQIQIAAREKSKEVQKLKSDNVQKMIKESREQMEELEKKRKEELNQRISLIRELRALQGLTKLKKKEIDFTESPGFGFMYEMSIAELNERLNLLREELREEIERKRAKAQNIRAKKKQVVQNTQEYINQQRQNRVPDVFTKKSQPKNIRKPESEELQQLREKLNETRKLRQVQNKQM